jgi:hypothetical protein
MSESPIINLLVDDFLIGEISTIDTIIETDSVETKNGHTIPANLNSKIEVSLSSGSLIRTHKATFSTKSASGSHSKSLTDVLIRSHDIYYIEVVGYPETSDSFRLIKLAKDLGCSYTYIDSGNSFYEVPKGAESEISYGTLDDDEVDLDDDEVDLNVEFHPQELLKRKIPGILEEKDCPWCHEIDTLWEIIQHMNDEHRASRESIADWLDTLDVDITFQIGEQNDNED